LVCDATKVHGIFKFVAAKRGSRIGWADAQGHIITERYFAWSGGTIFWREATPDEIALIIESESQKRNTAGTRSTGTIEDFYNLIPLVSSLDKNVLLQRAADPARGDKRIGLNKGRAYLTELIDAEPPRAFEWRIKRAKTNPRIEISRHAQPLI
jgi:hypothetical protein